MSEPFLGEIRTFGFNFAPQGWAMCGGQLMPINQNTALFSLLGTQYGGDGIQTFALPDLRSRVGIHNGQGPGLSPYDIGEEGGAENVALTTNQMPAHNHTMNASGAVASGSRPAGEVLGRAAASIYAPSPDGTLMNAGSIGSAGGGQPFSVLQPFLVLNFCIALQGIFPSRN